MIRAIVCDIEGTICPMAFAREVLRPYAAEQLPAFVREHRTEKPVRACLDATARLAGLPSHDAEVLIRRLRAWIDDDVTAAPLDELRLMIWRRGYESGAFRGHVYADAVRNLRDWFEARYELYVYSSVPLEAQELFLAHSRYGDLRPLFKRRFDTATGEKTDAASYRQIASSAGHAPGQMLYVSDAEAELDAAAEAGWHTRRLARRGDGPADAAPVRSAHPLATGFDDIDPAAPG